MTFTVGEGLFNYFMKGRRCKKKKEKNRVGLELRSRSKKINKEDSFNLKLSKYFVNFYNFIKKILNLIF